MVAFLIILSIIIVGAAIYFPLRFRQKKYEKFVLKYSDCLKQLNEINSRYKFYPNVDFDQSYTYDNENFYDTISCEDYLIYQLRYMQKKVREQIEKINSNRRQYSAYVGEIKAINRYGRFSATTGNLRYNTLLKTEKRLMEKQTHRQPTLEFSLRVTLYCSKINGEVYAKKSQTFSAGEIVPLIKRINNRNGDFFYDRGIWDAICRVERGKVSNKMRFAIYDRDGHRCRKCGVSELHARLEIDHIVPIAKGGKSTYDNLQTLCHKCNVEKGTNRY